MNKFQVEIPEVYQIETTNQCQLDCNMCIRKDERVKRDIGFLNPELISLMTKRGDFAGSYFVELQMYGEPLIYPYLNEVIDDLHAAKVKVGLSTNGLLIDKKIKEIMKLDYITVSIDATDKEYYERQRQGSNYTKLVDNINFLISESDLWNNKLRIDLQVIDMPGQYNLPALISLANDKNWINKVNFRSVPDCFGAYQNRPYNIEWKNELCLNPWTSVSVHWNGDVVSCCFCAGDHNIYGNLYKEDLKTIWNTSKVRKELQRNMLKDFNKDGMPCKFCYMRSPVLMHQKMLANWIKE